MTLKYTSLCGYSLIEAGVSSEMDMDPAFSGLKMEVSTSVFIFVQTNCSIKGTGTKCVRNENVLKH